MKKSVVFMAFICLIFSAKSQTISNSPSAMYALGYTYGLKEYNVVLSAGGNLTPSNQTQISNIQDRVNNLYDQIMETYNSSATANAFRNGYINGTVNSGQTSYSSNYTPPSSGSSLDGLVTYDASMLYLSPNYTSTYLASNVTITSGGNLGIMTIKFQIDGDTLTVIISFK